MSSRATLSSQPELALESHQPGRELWPGSGLGHCGRSTHLLVPLQQHSTAVVRGALKALVDVLHEQVHPVLVQRLHRLLNVVGFEGDEHLQHDALSTVLSTGRHRHNHPGVRHSQTLL